MDSNPTGFDANPTSSAPPVLLHCSSEECHYADVNNDDPGRPMAFAYIVR